MVSQRRRKQHFHDENTPASIGSPSACCVVSLSLIVSQAPKSYYARSSLQHQLDLKNCGDYFVVACTGTFNTQGQTAEHDWFHEALSLRLSVSLRPPLLKEPTKWHCSRSVWAFCFSEWLRAGTQPNLITNRQQKYIWHDARVREGGH